MADTIAKSFGIEVKDSKIIPRYYGDEALIIWTGGDLINLTLKEEVNWYTDLSGLTAEEITRKCYTANIRTNNGLVSPLDRKRIAYIEDAISYCDDVVFMCQPSVEGEKIVQAIKLFFGMNDNFQSVVLDEFTHDKVYEAALGEFSSKVNEYRTRLFMKQAVHNDINERECVEGPNVDTVTPDAILLLNAIKREYAWYDCEFRQESNKKPREATIGGVMDINRLYAAMDTKYGMRMLSMWDSLLYLYAKGLINNPMTHLQSIPDTEVCYGVGYPEIMPSESPMENRLTLIDAIQPIDTVEESLLGLEYDHKQAPDSFLNRTSAIYSFIVEQTQREKDGEKPEVIEVPSFEETESIPVADIMGLQGKWHNGQHSFSVNHSLGRMLESLYIAEFFEYDGDGYVYMNELERDMDIKHS